MPKHIAIIMDGNRKWAKSKGLPATLGHKAGAETARKVIDLAQKLDIQYLTLYAFSSENWNRPETEVNHLMKLLEYYINTEQKKLSETDVKIIAIGNLSKLPESLRKSIQEAEKRTTTNNGMTLAIALSYGGREEIVHATKKIASMISRSTLSLNDIDENLFTSQLYTYKMPDPDLLIRTSGEIRLSNFLLWQSAYTEFYFTKKNWPDFSGEDLKSAIAEFKTRKRKYGK